MKKANCHIHLPPNFSAFVNVDDALESAKVEGLRLLGTSNYYDYAVYGAFARKAKASGIFPLLGLEVVTWMDELAKAGQKINDPGNPGKAYLCGKAIPRFDSPSPKAAATLGRIRTSDQDRIAKMALALDNVFTERGLPTVITLSFVCAEMALRLDLPVESVVLQERHLAEVYQEHIFEHTSEAERGEVLAKLLGAEPKGLDRVTVQGDIRTHLMKAGKPAYVAESFIPFDEGVSLVLELGGLPCYPVLADGAKPICAFEETPETLVANLRANGLVAAELIPNRNRADVLRAYVHALRDAGIVVSAGTEHNTQDRLSLVPQCADGPVPDDVAQIFWEGACVLAAHQEQVANGKAGFIAPTGERIAEIDEFAKLGEAILD